LAAARRAHGLSQNDVARLAGLNPMTISRYEREKGDPPTSLLVAIAAALRVSVEWLATGEGEGPVVGEEHPVTVTTLGDCASPGQEDE
jgi:transcriptional regulator with XRE-family HTH domain